MLQLCFYAFCMGAIVCSLVAEEIYHRQMQKHVRKAIECGLVLGYELAMRQLRATAEDDA